MKAFQSLTKVCLFLSLAVALTGCAAFIKKESYCPRGLVEEDGGGFFAERDGGGYFIERDGGGFFIERDGGGYFIERDELLNPIYQVTCRRGVRAPAA